MRILGETLDSLRSRVTINSVVDCPPIKPKRVKVLVPHDGADPVQVISVQRPTYFEKVCTVTVEGISSPRTYERPTVRSARSILDRLSWHARGIQIRYAKPLRFNRPVLDTRDQNPRNIAHILMEIIPLCLHARRCVGPDVSFVFDHFGRTWESLCRELLAAFEIDPIQTNRKIAGPIIHIRGTRGLAAYDVSGAFDCPHLTFFPDTFRQIDFRRSIQYDKIFLARKDTRALINHVEVERLTKAHGYKTVYMEEFSIQDQMSIGANARHVIAVHGAAMAFLSLNQNISSLIELFPPHVYNAYFPIAFGATAREHILVIQEFDERVIHNGWPTILYFKNRPFAANLDLLERAIQELSAVDL